MKSVRTYIYINYYADITMSTQYLLSRDTDTIIVPIKWTHAHSTYCTDTGLCYNQDLDMIPYKSLRLHSSWDLFIVYHYHDCEN